MVTLLAPTGVASSRTDGGNKAGKEARFIRFKKSKDIPVFSACNKSFAGLTNT